MHFKERTERTKILCEAKKEAERVIYRERQK